jgi:hypothetical protein
MANYETIVQEVNKLFSQYHTKMTLRQIYYRLVSKLIIQNTLNQYKRLSRLLVKAREKGDVNYRNIEDRARVTLGRDSGWDSPLDFLNAYRDQFEGCWEYFSMKMWKTQPKFVEVWIEKDALSRVASESASNYRVRTCPSKGYSSYTYIADAVSRLRRHRDQECIILYLGDFDPSGLDITRDLASRLQRYGADVTVRRLALSIEQIQEHNLPPMPAKTSDSRYANFVENTGGSDAVELDALEPPVLKQIIRDGIKAEIDMELWDERLIEIELNKEKLKGVLENMTVEWDISELED